MGDHFLRIGGDLSLFSDHGQLSGSDFFVFFESVSPQVLHMAVDVLNLAVSCHIFLDVQDELRKDVQEEVHVLCLLILRGS